MGDEVRPRGDRLRRERFRHPARRLLRADHRSEVARGIDLVHDDHVALVVARELQGPAVGAAVEGQQAIVRLEAERDHLPRRDQRRRERIAAAFLDRELEGDGHDRHLLEARDEARLAKLADPVPSLVGVRQGGDGAAGVGEPAHPEPRDGRAIASVDDRAVAQAGRERGRRADLRVLHTELRDVHPHDGRQRRERRRDRGARDCRGGDGRDEEDGDARPHDGLAYTSGLSTPTNGRLRYRWA